MQHAMKADVLHATVSSQNKTIKSIRESFAAIKQQTKATQQFVEEHCEDCKQEPSGNGNGHKKSSFLDKLLRRKGEK